MLGSVSFSFIMQYDMSLVIRNRGDFTSYS